MNSSDIRDLCYYGCFKKLRELYFEGKLKKEDVFSPDDIYNGFSWAYERGHLNICIFLILKLNITKDDLFKDDKQFYIKNAFQRNQSRRHNDAYLNYVHFLIEYLNVTENEVQDYLSEVSEERRKKILECFAPLGSSTKPARNEG